MSSSKTPTSPLKRFSSKLRPKLRPSQQSSYSLRNFRQRSQRECEARVALVCYGGVSMAIWVAGVTAEILNCITGSRMFEEGYSEEEASKLVNKSAMVYYRLLKHIHDTHPRFKLDVRVVVDLIGGTSAGGINGICLASAVSNSLSVSPLRDFWLEKADIEQLRNKAPELEDELPIDRKQRTWGKTFGYLFSKGIYKTGTQYVRFKAVNAITKMLPASMTEDGKVKALVDLAGRAFVNSTSIMSGPVMRGNMLEGVGSMFQSPMFPPETQTPEGKPLTILRKGDGMKLFVPITDHASYRRTVAQPGGFVLDSRLADEKHYSHVMYFNRSATSNDFGTSNLEALAFAARATSSFPLAFPGIKPSEFFPDIEQRRAFQAKYFPEYLFSESCKCENDCSEDLCGDKEFVDGGVLLNKPFEPVLQQLRAPRNVSHGVVHRTLMFVEPHPDSRPAMPSESVLAKKINTSRFPAEYNPPDVEPTAKIEVQGDAAEEESKRNSGGLGYKWTKVIGSVLSASISEPIGQQLRELLDQNGEIRKVNKMGLRVYNDTVGVYLKRKHQQDWADRKPEEDPDFIPDSIINEELPVTWDAYWKESDNVFHECMGESTPVRRLHSEMRASDLAEEITRVLCSKAVQHIPTTTVESDWVGKIILEHMRLNTDIMDESAPLDHADHTRFSIVRGNIWYFRDLLQYLQRAVEAPFFELSELRKPSEIAVFNDLLPEIRDLLREFITQVTYFLTSEQLSKLRVVCEQTLPRASRLGLSQDQDFHSATFVSQHRDGVSEIVDTITQFSEEFVAKHVFEKGGMMDRLATRTKRLPQFHAHVTRCIRSFYAFDVILFPIVHVTSFGEGEQVCVQRISPDDSQCLFWKSRIASRNKSFTETFLRCWPLEHFQGFLDAEARENDMLWGRLDGAESVINMVLNTVRNDLKEYIQCSNAIHTGKGVAPLSTKAAMQELEDTVMDPEAMNVFYQDAFSAIGDEFRDTKSELVQYLVESISGGKKSSNKGDSPVPDDPISIQTDNVSAA